MNIKFKSLIRKKDTSLILESIAFCSKSSLSIFDLEGECLFGEKTTGSQAFPINANNMLYGYAYGEGAQTASFVISHLVSKEFELKSMAAETLEKYRELALLYNLTEKLIMETNQKVVAEVIINEAKKIIPGEEILVSLLDPDTLTFEHYSSLEGSTLFSTIGWYDIENLKSEIINDIKEDERFSKETTLSGSIMFSPIKIKDNVIGVLFSYCKEKTEFTSKDIKLLSAMAFQLAAAIENSRLYENIKKSLELFAHTLSEAIEKRDLYTGGHTKRVMEYSLSVAKEMELSEKDTERLRLGAVMHDIGKIGIRDDVLLKPSKLSDEEWKIMKLHTNYGEEILSHVKQFQDIIPAIKSHHERFDGKGYPDGLVGEETDIIARIIAISDTFDAMTSDRPYRKGMEDSIAINELVINAGKQFDPKIVKAFISAYEKQKKSDSFEH